MWSFQQTFTWGDRDSGERRLLQRCAILGTVAKRLTKPDARDPQGVDLTAVAALLGERRSILRRNEVFLWCLALASWTQRFSGG